MKKDANREKDDLLRPEKLFQPTSARMFLFICNLYNRYVDESAALWEDNVDKKIPQTRYDIMREMPYSNSIYRGNIYRDQFRVLIESAFNFKDREQENDTAGMNKKKRQDYLDRHSVVDPACIATGHVPFLLTTIEKRWLRTFLGAPESRFLLDDELHALLMKQLKDVEPFDFSYWRRTQLPGDDLEDKENIERLRIIFTALREYRYLIVTIEGREQRLIPLRIRYNNLTNRYSVLALDEEDSIQRLHICKLERAAIGELLTNSAWEKAIERYGAICDENRAYFHLRLGKERNARERCYASFVGFNKKSYRANDGSYRLTISYYKFDEEDVLNRILALGPIAMILPDETKKEDREIFGLPAGNRLRSIIVERLKAALPHYASEQSEKAD